MMKKQRGAMLIDLLFGCALAMGLILAFGEVVVQLQKGRDAHRQGARLSAGAAALEAMLDKHAATLAASGSAPGFANALAPTEAELRNAGFLPAFVSTQMPFGGVMTFAVRVGTNKDLLGLACGSTSVQTMGQPGSRVAGQIMHAANGRGLRTTAATPGRLSGPGFQDIPSPINGAAIVCAWSALGQQ